MPVPCHLQGWGATTENEALKPTTSSILKVLRHATLYSMRLEPATHELVIMRNTGNRVHNLVDNAIKYTGPGGKVLVGSRRKGDRCRTEVYDTGIGIPADKLSQIFDAFYRVGDVEAGALGLGLSIVKSIAEALGYRVRVKSQPNKGTCFSIEAPLAESQA